MATSLHEVGNPANPLTPLDRARLSAHSEVAEEKRRQLRELTREDVVLLRRQGMVPVAIADQVRRSVEWVSAVLREEGFTIPGYLDTTGGKKRDCCPHCGK